MTPDLYANHEPHASPVDSTRCEWAVSLRSLQVRQCFRKIRDRFDGHFYCRFHGKKARLAS